MEQINIVANTELLAHAAAHQGAFSVFEESFLSFT